MKTIPIWVVEGRTGELTQQEWWLVAVCTSAEAATKLKEDCTEWVTALGMNQSGDMVWTPTYAVVWDVMRAIHDGFLPEAPDQCIKWSFPGIVYTSNSNVLRIRNDQELEEFADALVAYRSFKP